VKEPLSVLTLAFCLGICSADKLRLSLVYFFIPALIFFFLVCFWRKYERLQIIFLLCLAFCLGAARLKASFILPKNHIRQYAYYGNRTPLSIKGFIASPPQLKGNQVSFILRAREIVSGPRPVPACGDILTYIRGAGQLGYGDSLIISGVLRRPWRAQAKSSAIMKIDMPGRVIKSGPNQGSPVKKFALWLKEKIQGLFSRYLSPVSAAILEAMVLGEKRHIPALIYNSMIRSGTVHILVVSGFNVGIVFLVVNLFLKAFRLGRRLRIYLAIPLLVIYCLVTGASNPVLRATIMGISLACAYLFKREAAVYNSLSLAALFILWLDPRQLFDLGFQLSFASVMAIVSFYPCLNKWLKIDSLKPRPLKFVAQNFGVSFSAWLGTAGLIAWNLRIFSPITALANLFIVPLATLITLCGFSLCLSSLVFSGLAGLFALPCELLCGLLIRANLLLLKIPAAYFYLPN
jgi:competence protein ComEC